MKRDPRLLGISSGSLPSLPATALAATVLRLGAGTVDLRWGKGHGWEVQGLTPFDDAGVSIAFIGVSVVLGTGDPSLRDLAPARALLDGRPPVPFKVFAARDLDDAGDTGARSRDLAGRQAAVLADWAGAPALVETHHGYASLSALGFLCSEFGCGLLLDVYGLHQLTGELRDEAATLRRWARAAQVKGFEPVAGGRHLPLARMPAPAWALLGELPRHAPVTVESRAGAIDDDLSVLRQWCEDEGEDR
jgi:hypothetical protein